MHQNKLDDGLDDDGLDDDGLDDGLDDEWIKNFKSMEQSYDKYYKSVPTKITCYIIFINKNNEVDQLLANKELLDKNGTLSKEKLITLINKYKKYNKYSFSKLLKYNITVDPININTLINQGQSNYNYMAQINNIQSIKFHDTIHMLHSINSLFLLYREKPSCDKENKNKTRRRNIKYASKTRKLACKNKHT